MIWFTFALFTSAIASRSKRLLIAAPFMVAGDVMHVAFQERAVLVHVFGDAYRAYQQATPFLVPTPASFAKFVRTVGRRTR